MFPFAGIKTSLGRIKKPELKMSDFKTRLVNEQLYLEQKLSKLDDFLESERSYEIDDVQKALLSVQATAMNTYNQCLKERLERL